METYHVGVGGISGEIFAGTLSKDGKTWKDRTTVTEEAICAVRDHLLNGMTTENEEFYGYEWQRKDGKKVVLSVSIR